MTAAEVQAEAEIRQLLARCTQAGDARKAEAYAACYAPDGILALDGGAVAGREAIRDWMRAPSVIPPPASGAPGFVSHHLTTCSVAFDGREAATARTYWLVTSAAGLDHNGFYVDRLVHDGGGWLIAHRRPRTLWISPASVLRRGDPAVTP
ncbi:nuclear transport factor 2 family protein [Novosphingobium soli]|uniref:Nuclear transport factor 2 family protein n=1 Tax=Novosphingobium soli TaxID=574956 RepID=A0ABV6CXT6_9SPHN